MINSSIALRFYKFFQTSFIGEKIDRKEVKIMVDSLIEQLCDYYLQNKPNGIQNVRSSVNRKMKDISDEEDIQVLKALNSMLREYNDAFSKSYSDHTDTFNRFFNRELRDLLVCVSRHSCLSKNKGAQELWGLLK